MYKGIADNSTDTAGYTTAINDLLKTSGYAMSDAKDYYDRAITAEILKWGKKYFLQYSEAQLEKTMLPKLIEYYKEPIQVNLFETIKEDCRVNPDVYAYNLVPSISASVQFSVKFFDLVSNYAVSEHLKEIIKK